jgi:D-amino-acid dehydrogenase
VPGSVVIVGAGAVGLSCAYFLQRAGSEVVVIDAAAIGDGASRGNAGWVSPSLSAPIPGPAALRTALRSIGNPASPLWLAPQPDLAFLLWDSASCGTALAAAASAAWRRPHC